MKKFTALLLVCAFGFTFAQTASSQSTRPRRVGSTPPVQPPTQQTQSSTPSQDDSQSSTDQARPTRPPVLGGANRDPNEQRQPVTKQKDAGPEEVGEGDIVRVSTTLVSIPVSVMDRDGRYIPDLNKEDFRIWENDVQQRVA